MTDSPTEARIMAALADDFQAEAGKHVTVTEFIVMFKAFDDDGLPVVAAFADEHATPTNSLGLLEYGFEKLRGQAFSSLGLSGMDD